MFQLSNQIYAKDVHPVTAFDEYDQFSETWYPPTSVTKIARFDQY